MNLFKVLSIDGGGIRGLIPAVVLREIERVTGRPISTLFDLVAGASTGGIIACALAIPDQTGEPKFTASDLVRFYEEKGPEIFNRSFFHTLTSLNGWVEEKYPAYQIERELMHAFGFAHFSHALVSLLIPAYEVERRFPFFFKSHRAVTDPSYDYPMWAVARAASAAPAYFGPARISAMTGETYTLIDGGMFANNPAMCAYVEARSFFRAGDAILVVSLGTGKQDRPILYEKASHWGKVAWALPAFDVMMDGVSDTVDYQLRQLLGGDRYFRFQVELTLADDDMDNVSPMNLMRLKEQGERLIEREREKITQLCNLLTVASPTR